MRRADPWADLGGRRLQTAQPSGALRVGCRCRGRSRGTSRIRRTAASVLNAPSIRDDRTNNTQTEASRSTWHHVLGAASATTTDAADVIANSVPAELISPAN